MVALVAVLGWLWIAVEIVPKLSFFATKHGCKERWSSKCDKEVRESSAIAGGAIFVIELINVLILWPALRNAFRYLRFAAKNTTQHISPIAAVPIRHVEPTAPCVPAQMMDNNVFAYPPHAGQHGAYRAYNPAPALQPAPVLLSPAHLPTSSQGPSYPYHQQKKANLAFVPSEVPSGQLQHEPPPAYW